MFDFEGESKLVSPEAWLEQEVQRVLTEAQLQPDPALQAEGWERRFIADAQRAKEAIELYCQLGLEVRAEPVRPVELVEECQDCRLVVELQYKTIYTRKKERQ